MGSMAYAVLPIRILVLLFLGTFFLFTEEKKGAKAKAYIISR